MAFIVYDNTCFLGLFLHPPCCQVVAPTSPIKILKLEFLPRVPTIGPQNMPSSCLIGQGQRLCASWVWSCSAAGSSVLRRKRNWGVSNWRYPPTPSKHCRKWILKARLEEPNQTKLRLANQTKWRMAKVLPKNRSFAWPLVPNCCLPMHICREPVREGQAGPGIWQRHYPSNHYRIFIAHGGRK